MSFINKIKNTLAFDLSNWVSFNLNTLSLMDLEETISKFVQNSQASEEEKHKFYEALADISWDKFYEEDPILTTKLSLTSSLKAYFEALSSEPVISRGQAKVFLQKTFAIWDRSLSFSPLLISLQIAHIFASERIINNQDPFFRENTYKRLQEQFLRYFKEVDFQHIANEETFSLIFSQMYSLSRHSSYLTYNYSTWLDFVSPSLAYLKDKHINSFNTIRKGSENIILTAQKLGFFPTEKTIPKGFSISEKPNILWFSQSKQDELENSNTPNSFARLEDGTIVQYTDMTENNIPPRPDAKYVGVGVYFGNAKPDLVLRRPEPIVDIDSTIS